MTAKETSLGAQPNRDPPSPHNNNSVHHVNWAFRSEAFRWTDRTPIGANFHPVGSELRDWLLRRGSLQLFHAKHQEGADPYTNPYTYQGSNLAVLLGDAMNEAYAFSEENGPMDPLAAEAKRVRLYTEQVLYTARVCEALIKQLLHCTMIPVGYYRGSGLGGLLSKDCIACRDSKSTRHKLSLIGSLAHRYHLCLEFDHCLIHDMKVVHRRRDLKAAHTGVCEIMPESAAVSRARLRQDALEVGNEFVHMLQHIGSLESHMIMELESAVIAGTGDPWWSASSRA
jgi:hypothetical protein